MLRPLWLVVLALSPAYSQVRVVVPVEINAVSMPTVLSPAPSAAAFSPLAFTPLAAPSVVMPSPAAPLAVAPIPAVAISPRASAPARVAAMALGVTRAAAALDAPQTTGSAARAAGQEVEEILTGAKAAATVDAADAVPATAAELDFAATAGTELGTRADDIGEQRGQKAARMSGAEFITLVEDARRAADAHPAPSPAAAAAAKEVRAALVRVVRALVPLDKPFAESAPRALSVWQVFDQEMSIAAGRGTLAAVADDARLFASQVEASVATVHAPELEPARPHPEDPEGYAEIATPGSIFDWKPIEKSPGHGLPPADALIRYALSDRPNPPRGVGFEFAGAASRQDARVYFYGERHTDGALITANMKRIVEDARPGGSLIVLVEGYTDWAMRGYKAVRYLADRGLDPQALAEKGITLERVEVRGWDTIDGYAASKHPLLQHHMDQLALNQLAHSDRRGWSYYRDFARAAWTAWRGWLDLWQVALVARNADLDTAVAKAAADAEKTGATVHVIAGSDHLLQRPRLFAFFPRLFPPSFRETLAATLSGRPYWASKPRESK
jgi:hypothetical protein